MGPSDLKNVHRIFVAIDLELNKDGNGTTDIIQVGAVAGDCITGKINDRLTVYTTPSKPLDPFIISLTGITQKTIDDKGISLRDAYYKLVEFHKANKAHHCLVQWGHGDANELKSQIKAVGIDSWSFGRREFDVKTLCQSIFLAKEESFQGGLKKMAHRFGLSFDGRAHDATVDAENTFRLFSHLLSLLRKI